MIIHGNFRMPEAEVHSLARRERRGGDSGAAVYLARGLISAADTVTHREWINECELLTEPPSERRGEEETPIEQTVNSENLTIRTYPNPTKRNVFVDVTGTCISDKLEFTVSSAVGQRVIEGQLNCNSTNVIDLTGLHSGIYLFHVAGEGTTKIVLTP